MGGERSSQGKKKGNFGAKEMGVREKGGLEKGSGILGREGKRSKDERNRKEKLLGEGFRV